VSHARLPRVSTANRSGVPSRLRLGRLVLVILVVALGAVGLQEAVRRSLGGASPTGSAEWIWERGRHRQVGPWVFWAVQDFELPEVPASAHALVLADAGYILHVNGRRVGSNVYRDGDPVDRYEVASLLYAGSNRLAVELRSGRGAGGLLLRLVDGADGDSLVGTDDTWRTFNQDHPGILHGWLPLSEGEPALSWGPPPVGRWGLPRKVVARASFSAAVGETWEQRPVPPRRVAAGPEVLRQLGPYGERRLGALPWRPVDPEIVVQPPGGSGLGPVVLFDWGREVTGYLTLDHGRRGRRPPGLLRVGRQPPIARLRGPDATVVTLTGGNTWQDGLPRRFRYALVLGVDSVVGAWVDPVHPEVLDRLPAPPPPPAGLFGLEPPRSVTPVENEVGRKLQGFTGGARGEEL